ncbi:hypothetical protein CKAN_00495100 [Cinnamomum micranthum f. kanehirae]|uniref:Transmembrane protein n=1 Tax=Cinnamomum micranthum f. kanehirae TaxID=337451 RepID=A0A443NDF1_9MAGN|nr:hypothetical protein CKAN_00495100 [Cinnamomum micranthum f. kanehirae]
MLFLKLFLFRRRRRSSSSSSEEREKEEEEEEEEMAEEGRGTPHGLLLALVLGIVVGSPFLIGDGGGAISDIITGIFGPAGLLLLPVILLILIHFLSSDRAAALSRIFSPTERQSIHSVGGSPVGVALFLLLILFLLYHRTSLFGPGGGGSGD